ncbi:MAG: FAD-dependent oxidoreductase [Pirellulaceae bacterium]
MSQGDRLLGEVIGFQAGYRELWAIRLSIVLLLNPLEWSVAFVRSAGQAVLPERQSGGVMEIAILGAGLFGSGLALELAGRGLKVNLIDSAPVPVHRAARRNEGKVHLGFVYAMEKGARTAAKMMQGALAFRRSVVKWIGEDSWNSLALSTPYHYLVLRDSLMGLEGLEKHYQIVQKLYEEELSSREGGNDYLGLSPGSLWEPLCHEELARYASARLLGGYRTEERAIDTDGLCDRIAAAIFGDHRIGWIGETDVTGVSQRGSGLEVEAVHQGKIWTRRFDVVINATWTSRAAIDQSMGIHPPKDHLLRLKYRVLVELPRDLHLRASATIVLGPFGDIVVRQDGRGCLSWYPVCLQGWTNAILPPSSWDDPMRGETTIERASEIGSATLQALDPYMPGLLRSKVLAVDAGGIVARGCTDVGDPTSRLHSRNDIGIMHHVGTSYYSVDPGKWTTAPWYAARMADQLIDTFGL